MLWQIQNNSLIAASAAAEGYLSANSGLVDLLPVSAQKRRSMDANAKYWAWCGQVERDRGWQPGDAHRWHKWQYGLAILTRKHPAYRDRLMGMLRALDYEQRLEAMDLITCTSEFTTCEMSEFMAAVQRHWAGQGVILD